MIWPGGLCGCLAGSRPYDDTLHTVIFNGRFDLQHRAKLPRRRTLQNTLAKVRMVQYVQCRRRFNIMESTAPLRNISESTETLTSFCFKGAAQTLELH